MVVLIHSGCLALFVRVQCLVKQSLLVCELCLELDDLFLDLVRLFDCCVVANGSGLVDLGLNVLASLLILQLILLSEIRVLEQGFVAVTLGLYLL